MYWAYWASKGNVKAQALVATSVVEALTRLCDDAFGIKTDEVKMQQQNVDNMELNKLMFSMLHEFQAMRIEMRQLTSRTEKLDKIEENGKRHSGCLNVLEHEPDNDNYITARQFLMVKGLQNSNLDSKLARRSAQAMRVGKNIEVLPTRKGQVLYSPEDVSYLEEALKSVLGLD